MYLLALSLLVPLTACHSIVAGGDPYGQCIHPEKPPKPYTDKKVATLITEQARAIDVCRALLGN